MRDAIALIRIPGMRWPRTRRTRFQRNGPGPDLGWMLEADGRRDEEAHVRCAHEAMAESPVTAGWILNVQPHRVEGYMGVSLWVALLGLGGRLDGRRIWIEASGVQDLLDMADRIRSPEFREAMGDFGDSYT